MVAVNIIYDVGSRDEDPQRTGFAHLFEHLMFSGSKHVKDFDEPMQRAGGENNAETTNDYTAFHEVLPAANLETALWLESDRMLALRINQRSLDIQRRVVIEEFKETCLNEPYGDSWHHLSELMFREHPYRWPVIGLTPEHIEAATLDEVRSFYTHWYTPQNAVVSICGRVDTDEAVRLVDKWFGSIPGGERPHRAITPEPVQTAHRTKTVQSEQVPVPAVYLAFRMPSRLHPDFYPVDLITDVLAQGHSSRLYRHLLREQRLFTQIDAYITANTDQGMLVVEGRPAPGISTEQAYEAIWTELHALVQEEVPERELNKVKHRFESMVVFSELNILNKAQNLGFYEILKEAEYLNEEVGVYLAVEPQDLQRCAKAIFTQENSVSLTYLPA
jgi:zinc protease